ncbi:MAG: transpeptidase family protein [Marinifilaceae bacterium]|nr:transpeptidase family protein [Marinifilaceae bacterium]
MSDSVNKKAKRGKARSEIIFRMGVVLALVFLAFMAIVFKVIYLTTIGREENMKHAYTEQYEVKKLPRRGEILAANHVQLSVSVPYYTIDLDMRPSAISQEVYNKGADSLALCLSRFFKDRSKREYRRLLDSSRRYSKGTIRMRDSVSYFELNTIKSFPIFRRGVPVGGYVATEEPIRIRPMGNMAARTIGMYNYKAKKANGGLELYCDEWLAGEPGRAIKHRVVGRSEVEMIVEPPVNGASVVTTIDVEMQDIVTNALKSQIEQQLGEWGCAVLMEVETGDIKAIANFTRRRGGYIEDENHAVRYAAELGSVMKTATFIALFEDGEYEPNSVVSLGGKGYYEFQGKKIRESRGHTDLDSVTIKDMYKMSSNGISMIANNIYGKEPARLLDRWRKMGLYDLSGIQLKGESRPIINHPDSSGWDFKFNNLPWMIIGYSLTMTPMQMCTFYNGIANGGQRVKPRLIKEIIQDGKVIESFDVEEVGDLMYSSRTREYLDTVMRAVVAEKGGTGYRIRSDNYQVAGKTGTAFWSTGGAGYVSNKERCTFVGYFPADAPKYTCIVVIDDPKKGASGGAVSGPVFKEIADKVYAIMGRESNLKVVDDTEITEIPVAKGGYADDLVEICKELDLAYVNSATGDWVKSSRIVSDEEESLVELRDLTLKENLVPNVIGMGLRDALYLMESCGMRVTATGSGRVYSQSAKAGSRIVRGGTVELKLR